MGLEKETVSGAGEKRQLVGLEKETVSGARERDS